MSRVNGFKVLDLEDEKSRCESLLAKAGCSKEVAEEIWKWYDSTNKKGVASY
jgi:hypothetical protein